jgi:hypothetical protein
MRSWGEVCWLRPANSEPGMQSNLVLFGWTPAVVKSSSEDEGGEAASAAERPQAAATNRERRQLWLLDPRGYPLMYRRALARRSIIGVGIRLLPSWFGQAVFQLSREKEAAPVRKAETSGIRSTAVQWERPPSGGREHGAWFSATLRTNVGLVSSAGSSEPAVDAHRPRDSSQLRLERREK